MVVRAGGKVLHTWKISSGRQGYETPTGTFRPGWMARQWFSRKYDMAPMPYSVFFNGGIATHGTTATGRLGRPASHGCIRLETANAKAFYNLVRKHGKRRTRISVVGTTPVSAPRYASGRSRQPRRDRRAFRGRRTYRTYRIEPRVTYRVVRPHGTYRTYRTYRFNSYTPPPRRAIRPYRRRELVYPGDRPRTYYRYYRRY